MIKIGSGNWIVDNLNSALETWNGKLTEIWQLISTTPEEFKGGGVNCTPKVGQESQRKGCRNLWEKNCSVRN